MKKPELLVTPISVEDIQPLIVSGADAFVIGEQKFGLRLAGEFNQDDVKKAIELAHEKGKKVYVAINAIFHNDKIDELYDYVSFLKEVQADAIIFGDPAVLMVAREVAPKMKLHWSTETTGTNWYTCNYWGSKGAKRSVLAREISMDSIIEIKEHADVEIEIQVHGMTTMFQSKRSLLGHYFQYQGKENEMEEQRLEKDLFLHDKERDNKYPIFEDENGTHIMSPNDICIVDELQDLIDAGIDSFKIDGLLKDAKYIQTVTGIYRKAIDLYCQDADQYEEEKEAFLAEIEKIQPANRSLDTGFFFKETVY
ncbi:peptidase U32 family protein [Niallia sp. 03133]|uniref:peptidase U32 family protein n=1 Tax=Niallia sp. 03133 TaxID=3458060 RepID=UPI00404469D1